MKSFSTKIVLMCIALVSSLCSCKKNYTCQCSQGGTIVDTQTIRAKNKPDADAKCTRNNQGACFNCYNCQLN